MERNYDTLSEGTTDLMKRGYLLDFNLKSDCIQCIEKSIQLYPSDFKIDEVYRFEGATNPADNSILYAISSNDDSLKGVLVDAYGVYSESLNEAMIKRLSR